MPETAEKLQELTRRVEVLERIVETLVGVIERQIKAVEAIPGLLSESVYRGLNTRQVQVCDAQGRPVIRIHGGDAPGETGILISDPGGRCAVLLGVDEESGSVAIKSDGVVLAALHADNGASKLFASNTAGETVTVTRLGNDP